MNVWKKPLQYCKVISFQLIKINEKKRSKKKMNENRSCRCSTQGIRKREPQNRPKENIGMELIVIKIN